MRKLFLLLCILFSLVSFGQNNAIQTMKRLMKEQETAWNNGNLQAFMQPYWQSDSLLFVGKNGPTYGWNATLKRYEQSYPTKDAMGELKFEIVETRSLSKNCYLMLGKWTLIRKNDQPGGYFTLVWKKIGKQWVIVADHSS